MVTERNGGGGAADTQRGAVLLLALVLTVSLSMLALSVLASRDMAVVVADHAEARARARHAAASGIEWATAVVMDQGFTAQSSKLVLADGGEVAVTVDPATSPQIVATGRCDGVEVRLAANVRRSSATLPYAYASFAGSNRYDDTVFVKGSAWFEESLLPIAVGGSGEMEMYGDLYLRSIVAPPVGKVIHKTGATFLSQPAIGAPAVDVSPFASMVSGAVPVVHYSGDTTIKDRVLTGIIDVALAPGDKLQIENAAINGTLVVRRTGLLSSLVYPEIELKGTVKVGGGTSITGNLALLAPLCRLTGNSVDTGSTITGVTVVLHFDKMRYANFSGQVVVLGSTLGTNNTYTIERPAGFEPDTPIGVTWPGSAKYRITWLGEL
jgi:hypothetical protein